MWTRTLKGGCLFLTLALAFGCSENKSGGTAQQGRLVPVRAATVKTEPVEQTLSVIGHVEASASVKVTSQVGGQLLESRVRPGSRVRAGAVLFKIDPRSFQATLNQAEASIKGNRAQLRRARQDLERYRVLASKDFLSQQQYEQSLTEVESLEATIAQSEAVRDNAQLNLSHTAINAPISGRVGEVLVDPGNNIKANETVLLVINTIRPANVSFSVPERYLPELKRRLGEGHVTVTVRPEGDKGTPISGELYLIDNEVNRSTGTIAMRARFANNDERLWPGQFVRVNIIMDDIPAGLVIPQSAILEGISSRYVYVVNAEGAVQNRDIESQFLPDGRALISNGLKQDEIVVTDGQLNLAPGSRVEILGEPAAKTPDDPNADSLESIELPKAAPKSSGEAEKAEPKA